MAKVVIPFFRTPFNYDHNEASDASGLDCSNDKGRTRQSEAESCDINVIVKRFGLGGELPVGARMPTYGDFTGISDFQEAMHAVQMAEDSFMLMPASIRSRFENDAGKFVDFCSNPDNLEEARKLGLVPPEEVKVAPGAAAAAASVVPPKGV